MKRGMSLICSIIACAVFAPLAQANSVVWPSNGHTYEIINAPTGGISWADAQADALNRGGYLATLTSAAENNFVYDNLINDLSFWGLLPVRGSNLLFGPWIGGLQPAGSAEPAGGWEWVNGDGTFASTYTNWRSAEPSNSDGNTGAPEDRVHFFAASSPSPFNGWNDADGTNLFPSYVVEYNVPEPTSLCLLLGSTAMLMARRRFA